MGNKGFQSAKRHGISDDIRIIDLITYVLLSLTPSTPARR